MHNLGLLIPEFVMGGLALGLLAVELILPKGRARWSYYFAAAAAVVGLVLVGGGLACPHAQGVGTLWAVDPFSRFLKLLILGSTVLAVLLALGYRGIPEEGAGAFCSLLLLSATGMMFLVSAVDLLLVFVSLELVSIASFILAGYERTNPKSNEGAVKYFIFGAFSSAIMAFGISLFYGAVGSTRLIGLELQGSPLLAAGILFILIGFGFKAAIAPMHFWVPDAYEGAPTPVTAFLSVAPKIAALGALVRLLCVLIPASSVDMTVLLTLLCGLTMTVGNFVALFQKNIKRLLAYSAIAQAGYIMIGIVTGNPMGMQGVLFYSFVYIAMNIGAFALAIALADEHAGNGDPYDLDSFNGLALRSFPAALAMTLFLLSLAGIPPLAGFVGKFYLIGSAVQTGFYGLAVVAVINSVVSVYYYMSVSYRMFFVQPREDASRSKMLEGTVPSNILEGDAPPLRLGSTVIASAALALAATLLFGILPDSLISWVQVSTSFLP